MKVPNTPATSAHTLTTDFKHVPVIVSNTRKVDLLIMSFLIRHFTAQPLKDIKTTQKQTKLGVPRKALNVRNFEPSND